jgi:TldD protein
MNDTALAKARDRLLLANDLDERRLSGALEKLLSAHVDFADLYFQYRRSESWRLEDGIVKQGDFGITQGVGVRAIAGARSALAFSDEVSLNAIGQAVEATRSVTSSTQDGRIKLAPSAPPMASGQGLYPGDDPLASLDATEKINLLHRIDQLARARDARIVQVMASLSASHDSIFIMRAGGPVAGDVRPLVHVSVTVVAEQNGRRETATSGGGGRYDYRRFDDATLADHVRCAVDAALVKLDSRSAPAGSMTVVCGPGWPGVLLHEAIGHGLEGDFYRKGTSAFTGLIGQRVAAKGVTVVDDGTLPGLRGSLTVDDEGCPTQCTTLIEDGILKGFMQDALNARLLGLPPTGNGRRESFAHQPLPRMTNTHMLNGEREPEEIIASVKRGLYAVNFGGGQVDITSGRFTFSATEAYLIENGKITAPVKGATLIGNGPESLKRVSMIGNDLAIDRGIATCGKNGQSVPVGVGQPTLRIDEMTVGGGE